MANQAYRGSKRVTVRVTADDIKRGERLNEMGCPIALAIRRKFHTKSIAVFPGKVEIRERLYRPCPAVADFINAFDTEQPLPRSRVFHLDYVHSFSAAKSS